MSVKLTVEPGRAVLEGVVAAITDYDADYLVAGGGNRRLGIFTLAQKAGAERIDRQVWDEFRENPPPSENAGERAEDFRNWKAGSDASRAAWRERHGCKWPPLQRVRIIVEVEPLEGDALEQAWLEIQKENA